MKPFMILAFLFILSSPAFAGTEEKAEDCFATAMTQRAMTVCSGERLTDTFNEMNAKLDEIRKRIENRPEKLKAFEDAQKAWEEYAQAQVDFLYIDHGGSASPMCQHDTAAYLTNLRIKMLERWLKDREQKNLCGYNIFYTPDPWPIKKLFHFDESKD